MGSNSAALAEGPLDAKSIAKSLRKGLVPCVCPRCGVDHILKFLWTGKGTPKKYCHRCRSAVENINENCIYEVVPAAYRVHRSSASAT